MRISYKITIPLGILVALVAGLTYNYIIADIGGIIFLIGLIDLLRKENEKYKNHPHTSKFAWIIFVLFIIIIAFAFWKFL